MEGGAQRIYKAGQTTQKQVGKVMLMPDFAHLANTHNPPSSGTLCNMDLARRAVK